MAAAEVVGAEEEGEAEAAVAVEADVAEVVSEEAAEGAVVVIGVVTGMII